MSHFAATMKSPVAVAAPVAAAAGDAKSPLFCPKPRRPVAPLRCHQSGGFSDAGMDLLDLFLSKVGSFASSSTDFLLKGVFLHCFPRHGADVFLSERVLGRERRAVCRRRPRSRRCSAARHRGERRIRWSTTAGSAWTARPCPCPCPCRDCRWWPPPPQWPSSGRPRARQWRRRRPCRRAAGPAGAPAPGSRSSPPRSASRVLTASTAVAVAAAMASPPWPRCTYNTPSNPETPPSPLHPWRKKKSHPWLGWRRGEGGN